MDDLPPPPLDPRTSALFLDFDGTLAEFADDPDTVRLPPGGARLIEELELALGGAVVLSTGRRIESLDRQIAPLRLAAGGLHGLQYRDHRDSAIRSLPASETIDEARRRLAPAVADVAGLRLEDKGAALVVHFRGAPELSRRAALIATGAIDGLADLTAEAGHAMFEIRMAGVGKDSIVRRFMEMPSFRGRMPVFVGDDRTDEDGFRAAQAMGGHGVKVGSGGTEARYRLPDVASVHDHLQRALGGGDASATVLRPEPRDTTP